MTAPRGSLLRDLRVRRVELQAHGNRLHVRAPRGTISEEERRTLRRYKAKLLQRLNVETRLLDLSLDEFSRQPYGIEFAVPWLAETLWFVPGVLSVEVLIGRGVRRGRIWTARELMDLGKTTGDDIRSLAHLKATFGAEILSVDTDPDSQ